MITAETSKQLELRAANVFTKMAGQFEDFRVGAFDWERQTAGAKNAIFGGTYDHVNVLVSKLIAGIDRQSATMPHWLSRESSLTNQSVAEKLQPGGAALWTEKFGTPRLHECVRVIGVGGVGQGIVEIMEAARPQRIGSAASPDAASTKRRALTPAPELYPGIDFARIRARANELRESTETTLEAVGRVVEESGNTARHSA